MAERKKVSKKANVGSWLNWSLYAHSCYNYERLQSVGFALSMMPVLDDLYDGDKEAVGREVEKHLTFFNTNPSWGGMIPGVVVAMEEERRNTGCEDSPVTEESIIAFKTGMMGPFAGLGDTIGQGILTPLFLSISISMAESGSAFAPFFNLIGMGIINIGIGYITWMYGYRLGVSAIEKVLEGGAMDKVMLFTGILGCVVIGGLAGGQVKVFTPLKFLVSEADPAAKVEETYMYVQYNLFDGLFKGLLSLGTIMGVLGMMRKGLTPMKVILICAVIGFILGALDILSNSAPVLPKE